MNTTVDLGTYRTPEGDLVHCWADSGGILTAELEGPQGRVRVDPARVKTAVKLSDDPFWPEHDEPAQGSLWRE
ncbi:MAG: hypothetical protein KGN00_01250 [Chloroflexota bacterium]|nr:hypothetical protein [Chloroflexota bacterium]MDE3192288.1 hypothetical protein [Chloroflexota bacterium]